MSKQDILAKYCHVYIYRKIYRIRTITDESDIEYPIVNQAGVVTSEEK